MTKKTLFLGDVTKPGEMGRIELLQVATGDLRPSVKDQTCLGADTRFDLLKDVPFVPCIRRLPGDVVAMSTPAELSASQSLPAAVAGKTSGARWVSIFAAPGGGCLPDPQLYRTPEVQWHVKGKFVKTFSVNAGTKPGAFCAYVSEGGLFDKLPDGPLTLIGASPFYAGDVVHISGPSQAVAGQQIVISYVGHASTTVELYAFRATQPCQASAQSEAPLAYASFAELRSPGDFTVPVVSPSITVSSYVCAYLQTGAPTDAGTPTGAVLTSEQSQITVVPAAAVRRLHPPSTNGWR